MERVDTLLETYRVNVQDELDKIWDEADVALVALGERLSPGKTFLPKQTVEQFDHPKPVIMYSSPEEALEDAMSEALSTWPVKEQRQSLNDEGVSDVSIVTAVEAISHPSSKDIEQVTRERQEFSDAVERARPGSPFFVISTAAMWTGVTGENPSLGLVNLQEKKSAGYQHLRAQGQNIAGIEAWFAGHGQESDVKTSSHLTYFPQPTLITDASYADIKDRLSISDGSAGRDGFEAIGAPTINKLLTILVESEFISKADVPHGFKYHPRQVMDSRSLLAIANFVNMGYDWMEGCTDARQIAAAEIVDSAIKDTLVTTIANQIVQKNGAGWFYLPWIASRIPAWDRQDSDIDEIKASVLERVKEQDDFDRLKGISVMWNGDTEQFVYGSVDNFMQNILGIRNRK